MRIIIFGSSGFIGSALVKHFGEQPHTTVDGCDIRAGESNKFLDQFYQAGNTQQLYDTIFQNQYDLCINCAGSASVGFSFENPLYDYELNTLIVFRILNAIKEYSKDCKFINLSSAAVYGNPESLPIRESQSLNPISPYGNHKMMSELITAQFNRFWNLKTISVRIFSAYGPGLRKQLLWDITRKIAKEKNVTLFGTGNETRDFIYVDDLVRAVGLISEQKDWPQLQVNIANGIEVSIREVADSFSKYYPEVNFKFNNESKVGDPLNWRADISYLNSLNYKPEYDIHAGIGEYVKWLNSL